MPTFVSFPHVISDGSITPGQHASFLGKAHDPLFIGQDPNSPDFRLPEMSLPANLSLERLDNRREILQLIDQQTELLEFSARARGIDAHYQRALAHADHRRRSRRRSTCPPSRTGSATPTAGPPTASRCLLARRLVEAGVKFINVYFAPQIGGCEGGWDTHGFNAKPMYPILKHYLLPMTNQTLPTLLTDLETRGLLETTLVVWVGEFGRSPRINNIAGRDHWPQCYTALLAGGGVKRGHVFGASDKTGAYPCDRSGPPGGPVGDDLPPAGDRSQPPRFATP